MNPERLQPGHNKNEASIWLARNKELLKKIR
jgi:hypothetical protein